MPVYATAPALLFVAVLMASGLAEIDWKDVTTAAPVTVTALTMPLTYSIANGIAFGFITDGGETAEWPHQRGQCGAGDSVDSVCD